VSKPNRMDTPKGGQSVAVEACAENRHMAVVQKLGFDNRLEGFFAGRFHVTAAPEYVNPLRSRAGRRASRRATR